MLGNHRQILSKDSSDVAKSKSEEYPLNRISAERRKAMNGQDIVYRVNGQEGQGYLSLPPSGTGPGLLVIQEWWGLVPHIRNMADRYAEHGFVCLAPDLYQGKTAVEPDEAQKMMMELEISDAAKHMSGAVEYLRSHEKVIPKKVGALGYCMGGGMTLYLASLGEVDAAAPYYGVLVKAKPDYSGVKCPIMGHYAEHDGATEGLDALKTDLADNGVDATFHIYEGTEHAFCNDDRPEIYNAEAAALAMERTVKFMQENLGS